jgi:hypothetical protein
VYAKAGMHVAAALIKNPREIIDHKLYWGTVGSQAEGLYLCSILNSSSITDLVRPMMSYGKDERDIDKHIWKLPIPLFEESNSPHRRLSDLDEHCANLVAALDLNKSGNFVTLRRQVRSALAADPSAAEINDIVLDLLAT